MDKEQTVAAAVAASSPQPRLSPKRSVSACRGASIILGLPAPEDPVCDSGIYCYGPLLDTIQMSRLYKDSKTFVDKKLKNSPGKIIQNFEHLVNEQDGALLSLDQIKKFVEDNFEDEGLELESWTPEDWTPDPEFIARLKRPELRGMAKRINRLWKDLSRKIKEDVKEHPSLYSIIYVPNGFVVPGGRFREFYYWDTYWIVKALLHYDMTSTVKGIVENFLLMVATYGMVPNGGRIYYSKRSQPPFLALMMKEYVDKTADVKFVRAHLDTLEKEVAFWETRRSVTVKVTCEMAEGQGQQPVGVDTSSGEVIVSSAATVQQETHSLFIYGTGGTGPRPESYREDVELANEFTNLKDREEFYYHIKAGAESGWDYSTRWMINQTGGNQGGLKEVKTANIIPVDLNALMFMNYNVLSEFHSLLGDAEKSDRYLQKARTLQKAVEAVLWDSDEEMWFDYDLVHGRPRNYFYPSNLFPLWAECYDPASKVQVAASATKYLKRNGALKYKGGVPTSLYESGQQWDYPNAWPPLQHILVAGLLKTEDEEARKMALTIARRYTVGAMFSCPEGAEVCRMYEKYNVNEAGSAGGGGEYDVQTGFGWTNGVVIDFMVTFGDELLDKEEEIDEMAPEDNGQPALHTMFDSSQGKSKMALNIAKIASSGHGEEPEKHELELSEKGPVHPALSIEDDDEPMPRLQPQKLDRQDNVTGAAKHGPQPALETLEDVGRGADILDVEVNFVDGEDYDDVQSSSSGISSSSTCHSNRSEVEAIAVDEDSSGSLQSKTSKNEPCKAGNMNSSSSLTADESGGSSFSFLDHVDDVKCINGKEIVGPKAAEDPDRALILHLVSANSRRPIVTLGSSSRSRSREGHLDVAGEGLGRPLNVQLGQEKDVKVSVRDKRGRQLTVNGIDFNVQLLQKDLLRIPEHPVKPSATDRARVVQDHVGKVLARLKMQGGGEEAAAVKATSVDPETGERVVFIKERLKAKDSVNGSKYDVDVDLKVVVVGSPDPPVVRRLGEPTAAEGCGARGASERDPDDEDTDDDDPGATSWCGRGLRRSISRHLFGTGGSTTRLDDRAPACMDDDLKFGVVDDRVLQESGKGFRTGCIRTPWRRRHRLLRCRTKPRPDGPVGVPSDLGRPLNRSKSLDAHLSSPGTWALSATPVQGQGQCKRVRGAQMSSVNLQKCPR